MDNYNQYSHIIEHDCGKCHKTTAGNFHTFWYGRSRLHSADALSRTYQIQADGSRSIWICNRCLWKSVFFHLQPWLLIGIPLFVFFSLTLQYVTVPIGEFIGWTLILYVFLYFTCAHSKYHMFEFWMGAGSRQAIKSQKSILKKQGYHLFWTPGQYEKMRSRKSRQ
jgi:hypothetical protein